MRSFPALLLIACLPLWSASLLYNIDFAYTYGGLTMQGEAPINEQWLATPAGLPVAAPTGSFSYDPNAQGGNDTYLYAFSNFQIAWSEGVIPINNTFLYGSPSCAGGQTGQTAFFELLTNCPSAVWFGVESGDFYASFNFEETDAGGTIAIWGQSWYGPNYPAELSGGTFTATDPPSGSVPEPSAAFTGLIGIVALAVLRRFLTNRTVKIPQLSSGPTSPYLSLLTFLTDK
jgi:hypothetical protein